LLRIGRLGDESADEYRRVLVERFGLTLRPEEVLALGLF